MRSFIYISDSKVDMLLPQIPAATKKSVSKEIGFDVKVLKGKISTSRHALDDRINRLLAVERHILKTEQMDSLTQPSPWISGHGTAFVTSIKEDSRVVFFFLRRGDHFLALGGSAGHLTGFSSNKSTEFGYSFAPYLLDHLINLDQRMEKFQLSDDGVERYLCTGVGDDSSTCWTSMVYQMCHGRQARTYRLPVSFLARRLITGTHDGATITLASPLFVAQG